MMFSSFSCPNRRKSPNSSGCDSGKLAADGTEWSRLADAALGLSYAEVSRAASEVLKSALIADRCEVDEAAVSSALTERKEIADRLDAYIA